MNGTLREPVRWSRRRWSCTLLGVFGLQLALLMLLGERPHLATVPPKPDTGIYPANDPWAALQIAHLPLLQDPTLFVLPNHKAYSESAWLTFQPLQHHLPDWTEPPRWLAFNEEDLGESFSWQAQRATNQPLLIADLPLPPLTGSDLPVPNQPMIPQSRVFLQGDLQQRSLREPIPLRAWTNTALLSNSVVLLTVDDQGWPIAATLLGESGLRLADQYAIQQAAHARFEALPHPDHPSNPNRWLTWGKMVFEWKTLMPAPTNATVAPP